MSSPYDPAPTARYYDLSHDWLTDDIPFLLEQAAAASGPLLEVGCGSGRLLVPLARAGHTVLGIDNAPEMLGRAEARLAAEPPDVRARVQLVAADVKALRLPDPTSSFALAFFAYNTFMHLDEAGAAAALRQLRALLRPGGVLLLDVDNPLALSAAGDDPDFALEDVLEDETRGETVRQYTAYATVPGEQAVDVTWLYESDAGNPPRSRARVRYHYFYPHQYDLLFGLTGFRLTAFHGDYDRRAFDEESERLIVVGEAV